MEAEDFKLVSNSFQLDYKRLYDLKQQLSTSNELVAAAEVVNIRDRWRMFSNGTRDLSSRMDPSDVDTVIDMMADVSGNFFSPLSSSISLLYAFLPGQATLAQKVAAAILSLDNDTATAGGLVSRSLSLLASAFPRARLGRRDENDIPEEVRAREKMITELNVEGLDPESSDYVNSSTIVDPGQRALQPTAARFPIAATLTEASATMGAADFLTDFYNRDVGLGGFIGSSARQAWRQEYISTYANNAVRIADRSMPLVQYTVPCDMYVEVTIPNRSVSTQAAGAAAINRNNVVSVEYFANTTGLAARRGDIMQYLKITHNAVHYDMVCISVNPLVCAASVRCTQNLPVSLTLRHSLNAAAFPQIAANFSASAFRCFVAGDSARTTIRAINNIGVALNNPNVAANPNAYIEMTRLRSTMLLLRTWHFFIYLKSAAKQKGHFEPVLNYLNAQGYAATTANIFDEGWWFRNGTGVHPAVLSTAWGIFADCAKVAKDLVLTNAEFLDQLA